MKSMTLRDIQMISLDILNDVHEFCVQNNIRYSLDGGSMLGAIRHNGFIPWDDDIDIIMPRPDYDRFFKMYHSKNGFKAYCYEQGNSIVQYGRVCDMERTFVIPICPWTKENTGVFIDIFPADGVFDTWEQTLTHIKRIKKLKYWVIQKRSLLRDINDETNILSKLKLILKKTIIPSSFNPLEKNIKLMKEKNFESCAFWGQLAYISEENLRIRMQPKCMWDSLILHKFEDSNFYIFSGYDNYLKTLYGDYMKLPPIEKRNGSMSCINYFWKS